MKPPLICLMGPTASGKKTCCRKLVAFVFIELAARVGIEDGADWGPYIRANVSSEWASSAARKFRSWLPIT